jgi:hypothetical protein
MPRLVVFVVVLALGAVAQAVDGVIEINQARAEAGSVTATDLPGFPVTIGVPGAYRLTGHLDVTRTPVPANATAIRIEASDVTLDLNGFAIVGPTICGGVPFACPSGGTGDLVRSVGQQRVVVRNGFVRGAGSRGLFLGARSTVEGLTVSSCAVGGISTGGGSRIVGNAAIENGGFGIAVSSGLIQGNIASSNVEGGISAGGTGHVSENTVEANLGVGITQAHLALRNVVRDNAGLGISFTSAFGQNVLEGNNGPNADPPQTSGGIEIAPNVCGDDTICP